MNYFHDASLDEAGAQLSSAPLYLNVIHAYNPNTLSVVYVKLFVTDTEPTYASDAPNFVFAIPPNQTINIELENLYTPACYIQASADAGAGATAPASNPLVTIIYLL